MSGVAKLLAGLIFLCGMISVYGILGPVTPHQPPVLRYPIVLLLSFIATLVHELGHAAVAARMGATIERIKVLPFEYDVQRRKLGWSVKGDDEELGGYVAFTLDRIQVRWRMAMIALAGPAANLLLTLVLALGLWWFTPENPFQRGRIVPLATALAVISAAVALANLIPFRGSDGQVVWTAIRRSVAGRKRSS